MPRPGPGWYDRGVDEDVVGLASPTGEDAATLRRWSAQAVDAAIRLVAERERTPPRGAVTDARPTPIPLGPPHAAETLIAALAERLASAPGGRGHPADLSASRPPVGALGWAAAPLIAAAAVDGAGGRHAAVELRDALLEACRGVVGLGPGTGAITTGAGAAAAAALAVARRRSPGALETRTVYLGAEARASMRRAAEQIGLEASQLRVLPPDDEHRLDPTALRAAIAADRAEGRRPLAVVATAGSVLSGAIDPLEALAELAAEEELWLHVDGGLAPFGAATPRLAPCLAGLPLADSLSLDLDRAVYAWPGTTALLLREPAPEPLGLDPEDEGLDRVLAAWLGWARLGTDGVLAALERDLELAERLARAVDATPTLERLAPRGLGVVLFRAAPPGVRDLDALNLAIARRLADAGRLELSLVRLSAGAGICGGGPLALRATIANPELRAADVDRAVAAVAELAVSAPASDGRDASLG